jgi:short subunit dehydrogenase-like uncharacterized protein
MGLLDYVLKRYLSCAGPFSLTSEVMVEACIRSKRHYLDITGEIAVFEAMAGATAWQKRRAS